MKIERETGGGKGPTRALGRQSGRRRAAQLRASASALGKKAPDLAIQCRHVSLDPAWRETIEQQVERWAERIPGLTRVHVTLTGGRHHRRGDEEASIAVHLARRRLFSSKAAATMAIAIREALRALEREVIAEREEERHVVRAGNGKERRAVLRAARKAELLRAPDGGSTAR